MPLVDYLCKEAVCMRLEPQRRDEAIRALLEQLVAGNAMPKGLVDRALAAILDRERLGSTAIGKGVAVPHARLEGLKRVLMAFGYSAQGVEFNALDRALVHQIFVVIGPKEEAEEYLSVMQRITALVQNNDFRRFVAKSTKSREVVALIKEMDESE